MKYIHFVRVFAFAVTVALALGGTMHGALAAQVKIYVDFGGGPEPLKGETQLVLAKANWIPVESAKWTTTTTSIPGGWNRVENKSDLTTTQSIGSQTTGAGAGKVTLTPAAVSNAPLQTGWILRGARRIGRRSFDLAKQVSTDPRRARQYLRGERLAKGIVFPCTAPHSTTYW